jgi:hypothetical protein
LIVLFDKLSVLTDKFEQINYIGLSVIVCNI